MTAAWVSCGETSVVSQVYKKPNRTYINGAICPHIVLHHGDDPIVSVLDLDRYVYRLLQQDAIDQAEAGDTVAIEEGHYWEDIETAVRLLFSNITQIILCRTWYLISC